MPDPPWRHAELIDGISVAFAEAIQTVSRGRYPLYRTPPTSACSLALRRIILLRQMGRGNWELTPSREPPLASGLRLRLYREAVSRNIGRARRMSLRSQVSPNAEDMGPIPLKDGGILPVPSNDENAPDFPDGAVSSHPPLGSPGVILGF